MADLNRMAVDMIDLLKGQVAALTAERDRLLGVVERFADHRPECAVGADYPCDCGLDGALQGLGQLDGSPDAGLHPPGWHQTVVVPDPTSPTYDPDQYGAGS